MEYIDGFMSTSRARKLKSVLEMLVFDPALVTNDMVEDVLKYKRLDGVDAALNTIAGACFAGGRQSLELEPRLGEIAAPVQVIWGREDRVLPVSHSEGLPTAIAVTVLDGAGHLVHMEKSADVNASDQASCRLVRSRCVGLYQTCHAGRGGSERPGWEG